MDYESSLDRALEEVPELGGSDERLSVPDPEIQPDGAFTRLNNLRSIANALSRDHEHVHRFIQRDLGTNGDLKDGRGRYNGTFTADDFEESVRSYVAEYVRCSECGLPDTRLVVEDRTPMLRCEACGAFRPVAKRSSTTKRTTRPDVEEGETYEVKITGTGRKGDGVAEKGKYTIFVPGAREGDVVNIYIEKVSGTLAFAQRTA